MAFAAINGQNIFFQDSGGHGIPIIMMHGFLMDQSLFDHQVYALTPTYRCIRFDARGFGQTQWDQKPFSLYDTVADCVGLMDSLSIDSAVIMGMSQGGYAALRLALTHPERVQALVLMSTQAGVDDASALAGYRGMRDAWVKHGPIDQLIDGLATALLGPNTEATIADAWSTWVPKWKTLSGDAIFHAMNNLLERDDITSRLHEITQPAFVSHGTADKGMPIELGRALSEQLPHCHEFVAIDNAAHAANFTHPHEVNNAVWQFLRTLHRQASSHAHVGCC